MKMEKMTKRDYFNAIRELVADRPDLVAFIDHEVELLSKKNATRSTKPTKSATETANVAEKILAVLPAGEKFTATEIAGMDETLKNVSNQRITAALKVLMNTGFVTNTREKGKSYFTKA